MRKFINLHWILRVTEIKSQQIFIVIFTGFYIAGRLSWYEKEKGIAVSELCDG